MGMFLYKESKVIGCCRVFITYFQLDLKLKDEKGGDISSFIPNGEWDLIGKNL